MVGRVHKTDNNHNICSFNIITHVNFFSYGFKLTQTLRYFLLRVQYNFVVKLLIIQSIYYSIVIVNSMNSENNIGNALIHNVCILHV